MTINLPTLILFLCVSHLMQVLVFFYLFRVIKAYSGIGWWLMWSGAEIVGFAFILFRSIPSLFPFVVIVQNTAIIAGTIFIYIGVMRFLDQKENLKIIISLSVIFVTTLLFFLFINDNIQIRSIIISITLAIISFLTARSLLKYKINSIRSTVNFNAVVFIIHGLIFLLRSVMVIAGTDVHDIISPTLFNILSYTDALIVSLTWTFGFIIMVNQRLNAEMKEAKEDFELIFNTSPDATVITRIDDGLILDINAGFTALTDFTREESIGKASLGINIWKNQEDRKNLVKELKDKGFCNNYEAIFRRKNGTEINALMSAKLIKIQGDLYIISITRDITERKHAERLLEENKIHLQELNATKDKFFSIIAHDLKSPLGAFKNLLNLMVENYNSFDELERKDIIIKLSISTQNIYNLLENLLNWAGTQTGRIKFNPESNNINEIILKSVSILSPSAKEKNISITTDLKVKNKIYLDANMINTVIRNLLSNAIKFTYEYGSIKISSIETDDFIQVSVCDNGVGLDKESISNLFRIDVTHASLGTDNEKGTGLGLILCKEFIEKHGGKIWIESEVGKGSTFYCTLKNN